MSPWSGALVSVVASAPALVAFACTSERSPRAEDADDAAALEATVVAEGLNGPIGIHVESDGTLWIADSGTGGDHLLEGVIPGTSRIVAIPWGATARLVRVGTDGTQTNVLALPSIVTPEGTQGAGRIVSLDGVLYFTSGSWAHGSSIDRPAFMAAIVRLMDGNVTELVTTWDIERRDNPAGAAIETNPFDLTVGPDRALWLTDAAGNTLYRIDPTTGVLELRAVFDVIPGPHPNPARGGAMEIEPVPTAVAFDRRGNTYVSLLPGVPFLPGSGKVVRVAADGTVTDYATGFTMLTDLVTGPDGRLYGVSIGQFTDQGPVPNSGAILRIDKGTSSQVILTGLSFPSTLAFGPNGDAYIALNAIGEPGSGQVVKYEEFLRDR
jgi:sugar lactone lactonase YvrE